MYEELRVCRGAHGEAAAGADAAADRARARGASKLGMDAAFEGRCHFFAASARAMQEILVDAARRRARLRGGKREREPLSQVELAGSSPPVDHLALDEALAQLAAADPLKREIVILRYYGGLSVEETAQALQVSAATVDRHWRYARAWLRRALAENPGIEQATEDRQP
ncbi:MAG: sigma-70 family RNA polymerase sigma factor [Planctomycetota bacterium]